MSHHAQSDLSTQLALFDFDHTLITTNSLNHLFAFLDQAPAYQRVLREMSQWLTLGDLTNYVRLKTAIKTHLYRRVLVGHKVDQLAEAAKVAAPKLKLNGKAMAAYHKAQADGLRQIIVTASPTEYIRALLPLLGITADYVVGTDLEADRHGILTGCFLGQECIRGNKPAKVAAFVEALAQSEGHKGVKIALAVGNPPDDDALLAMAPRAIAVDKTTGNLTILR